MKAFWVLAVVAAVAGVGTRCSRNIPGSGNVKDSSAQTADVETRKPLNLDTTSTPPGTHGNAPPVILAIGGIHFPISPLAHFADSANRLLPTPEVLPTADPHDASEGDKTYCYAFPKGFLTIDDNNFGLNGVKLMRALPSRATNCPMLQAEPTIQIGSLSLSLNAPPSAVTLAGFPGFARMKDGHGIERVWWSAMRREDKAVLCMQDYLSIAASVKGNAISVLEVVNTGEGWAASPIRQPSESRDTAWSCWSGATK